MIVFPVSCAAAPVVRAGGSGQAWMAATDLRRLYRGGMRMEL
jgi:hypothetical protein